MKLGKALATGVAQERPQAHDEEFRLAEQPRLAEEIQDIEASAPEEVPAAR